jgi:hypothetical protein
MNAIELNDGGVIEKPDDEFIIRRRDIHGNLEEVRKIGDSDHHEWMALFPEAITRLHLRQALDILQEFAWDVENRGLEIIGEDWPELLITYQHAVEVLS